MLNSDMKKSYFLLVFGEGSSDFWAVMWFHVTRGQGNAIHHWVFGEKLKTNESVNK